jgi:uncharacterized protein YqjF (DUF2071 family)
MVSRPDGSWSLFMRWHDLLFMHWPVRADFLRPLIPAALELDTYEGEAWLGIVPFRMSGIRRRLFPAIPRLSAFPELNVRTYVRCGGHAGVWFFSLDAASRVAVRVARATFHLPYFDAKMACRPAGEEIHYRSERTHRGAPRCEFVGCYRPTGPVRESTPGSLEAFLTDRLCLFTADRNGAIFRGDIHHRPWPLQTAEADSEVNSMAGPLGIKLPETKPLLHFARVLDVKAWMPKQVAC